MKPYRSAAIRISGILGCAFILAAVSCTGERTGSGYSPGEYPAEITLTRSALLDKIKGGWAGQVIGCTYGGPTEFDFRGTMIQDYTPIVWDAGHIEWYYNNAPGLYDDIYMDLTFVEVIDREGVDAPATSHAMAFANAEYSLWHANQAARYNILQGMEPPLTGHWEHNPHADDIDFQIEADFAGLMSPGMVNASAEICDRVGHIMNYGDGWYGGVYMAAMYALAFTSDDLDFIVREALRVIPEESEFHRCISDVISWSETYPEDWKQTWFEVEKKWSSDVGCPDGVFNAFNIDAKINAAYVVIGLLYGDGDFGRTVDISTRCGQDSDCNPASSGGILGTVLGYEQIPGYWKQGLDRVEDMDFRYTTISLNDTYEMGFRHALEMIRRNGGEVEEDRVIIRVEEPIPVRYEKAFDGHFPVDLVDLGWGGVSLGPENVTEHEIRFHGKGFVLRGGAWKGNEFPEERELQVDIFLDGSPVESTILPTSQRSRKLEVAWKYNLEERDHTLKVVLKDPLPGYGVRLNQLLVYGSPPS